MRLLWYTFKVLDNSISEVFVMTNLKNKWVCIVIGIVVFVLIFGVLVFNFVSSFRADQKRTLANIEIINTRFTDFSKNANEFNLKRGEIISYLTGDVYYETFFDDVSLMLPIFDEYVTLYKNINSNYADMLEVCKSTYSDSNANSRCNVFNNTISNISKVVSADIQKYNEMVGLYNNWANSNNMQDKNVLMYELVG